MVAAGRPVLRVSGRGRGLVVRASLADRDVLGLRVGDAARVVVDAEPDSPRKGVISEIARSASRATLTYEVEIRLLPDGEKRELLGGLSAKVELARRLEVEAAVPLSALQDADGPTGAVYALLDGRARRMPVRIAFLEGDRAVLSDGLKGVGQVITQGAEDLSDGAPVRLVP